MNNQENKFAKYVTGYLDQGAAGLKAGTVYKLQQARAKALAQLDAPEMVTYREASMAGLHAQGTYPGSVLRSARLWLGIIAIVAAFFGLQQWQVYQQTREIEELDTQLLSSDLPIDAYLDRGFQAWLTRLER
jgi:hypothetical protein